MRLVRVRLDKPSVRFRRVEFHDPEYMIHKVGDAVAIKRSGDGATSFVPWSNVNDSEPMDWHDVFPELAEGLYLKSEAVPERGTPRLQSAAISEMAEVSAMLDEHEAAAALEPTPEEAKHETGAVETKRRRRR